MPTIKLKLTKKQQEQLKVIFPNREPDHLTISFEPVPVKAVSVDFQMPGIANEKVTGRPLTKVELKKLYILRPKLKTK